MASCLRHLLQTVIFNLTKQIMFRWALTFLIVAIIAAIFGFGGIAVSAAFFAKIIFFIAVIALLISVITDTARRNN